MPTHRARLASLSLTVVAAGVLCCLSCGCMPGVPGMPGGSLPRDRLGCLPFPGLMTLYATADPARLGRHRYEDLPRLFQEDEAGRGIIYTERAGFVDLAHVRIAIDWTRYCAHAVRDALEARQGGVDLTCAEGDVFHVTLT